MMNGQRTLEKEGDKSHLLLQSVIYFLIFVSLVAFSHRKTYVYCFAFWSRRERPSGSMFSGVALHKISWRFTPEGLEG